MKLNINTTDILKKFASYKKAYLTIFYLLCFGLIIFSLYTVIVLKDDLEVTQEYNKKFQEMNITFDKKYLQDLSIKKSPTKLDTAAGKNPFLPF